MGLSKTTPIAAVIAEAGLLPVEQFIKWNNINFLTRNISRGSIISEHINSGICNKETKNIIEKYNILRKIGRVNYQIKPKNLKIFNEFDKLKKENISNEMARRTFAEINNKYKDYYKIFTDGSKNANSNAIGIYYKNDEIIYGARITNIISIKNIECIAILEALKQAINIEHNCFIIFTDSKSTTTSLSNGNSNRYYENEIMKTISKMENKKIIIQYIPGHKGIEGNNIADEAAKMALDDSEGKEYKYTTSDANKIIKNSIWREWANTYNDYTTNRGLYHKEIINGIPSTSAWFTNSNLKSNEMKLINRLRTGHAYDSRILRIMNKIDSNLCETCNVINDATHIIEKCKKYDEIRRKINPTGGNTLTHILKLHKDADLKKIVSFLNEIKVNL